MDIENIVKTRLCVGCEHSDSRCIDYPHDCIDYVWAVGICKHIEKETLKEVIKWLENYDLWVETFKTDIVRSFSEVYKLMLND